MQRQSLYVRPIANSSDWEKRNKTDILLGCFQLRRLIDLPFLAGPMPASTRYSTMPLPELNTGVLGTGLGARIPSITVYCNNIHRFKHRWKRLRTDELANSLQFPPSSTLERGAACYNIPRHCHRLRSTSRSSTQFITASVIALAPPSYTFPVIEALSQDCSCWLALGILLSEHLLY